MKMEKEVYKWVNINTGKKRGGISLYTYKKMFTPINKYVAEKCALMKHENKQIPVIKC